MSFIDDVRRLAFPRRKKERQATMVQSPPHAVWRSPQWEDPKRQVNLHDVIGTLSPKQPPFMQDVMLSDESEGREDYVFRSAHSANSFSDRMKQRSGRSPSSSPPALPAGDGVFMDTHQSSTWRRRHKLMRRTMRNISTFVAVFAMAGLFFGLGYLAAFNAHARNSSSSTGSSSSSSSSSSSEFGQQPWLDFSFTIPPAPPATTTTNDTDSSTNGTNTTTTIPTTPIDNSWMFFPHLPFPFDADKLYYRRVCANVHSSLLCLTLKFPFQFSVQDTNFSYPRPVDDRFYNLSTQVQFIDGAQLESCRGNSDASNVAVKHCLDAAADKAPPDNVVAVWTRQRHGSIMTDFYGVASKQQQQRIYTFFDKHIVLVVGGSTARDVAVCLTELFDAGGICVRAGINPFSRICRSRRNLQKDKEKEQDYATRGRRRLGANFATYATLPTDGTYIGTYYYTPTDLGNAREFVLPTQNLVGQLLSDEFGRDPNATDFRKLSLIIDYPIASVQSQTMLDKKWGDVVKLQRQFPGMILNIATSPEVTRMGYELEHMIAFDGIPEFYPTESGAYAPGLKGLSVEQNFIAKPGYPGWKPAYGSSCRGPLPDRSQQTMVNRLGSASFAKNGFDMRYYGHTWEFANQFWYQMRAWFYGHGLDCTLSNSRSGLSCVHKYFLMSMIDDHYDFQ